MLEAVLGACAIISTVAISAGFITIVLKKLTCDKEVRIAEVQARK